LNEASGSLKIERVSTDLGGTTLTFNAMSNRTCSVQFKSALNGVVESHERLGTHNESLGDGD